MFISVWFFVALVLPCFIHFKHCSTLWKTSFLWFYLLWKGPWKRLCAQFNCPDAGGPPLPDRPRGKKQCAQSLVQGPFQRSQKWCVAKQYCVGKSGDHVAPHLNRPFKSRLVQCGPLQSVFLICVFVWCVLFCWTVFDVFFSCAREIGSCPVCVGP